MRPRSLPLAISIILFVSLIGPLAPPASAQEGAFAVSGRVLSDDGAPISGARVSGWSDGGTGDRGGYSNDEATTDADGAYTLHLDAGKGWVNVWYDEWQASDARELVIEGDVADLDFTLTAPPPKTAIIAGVVTDEAGNPVAGATVDVWRQCCDDHRVHATEAGSGSSAGSDGASTPPSEPEPTATATSDARMIAPSYYPYNDGAHTTTDEAGQYTVKVYGGAYQINVVARGFAQESVQIDAAANETTNGDVTLLKVPAADAVLTGRVVDAATGAPLGGAWVSLNHLQWGRYANVQTGVDGRFELTTIPGWVQLSVHHYGTPTAIAVDADGADSTEPATSIVAPDAYYGREQYYGHTSTLKLASGDNEQDVDLRPKPQATHVLIGYAVDPDAETGIPGAQLSFWNQDTGDWGTATTDATGSYRITVRPGHYQVTGWAKGYLNGAATLVVSEDDATTRFDLTMPAGQTRYAPCYDEECDYERDYAVQEGGAKTAAGAPAPSAEPRAAAPEMLADGDDASRSLGASGAATWQGEGGTLPPYSSSTAGETPDAGDGGATSGAQRARDNVPGLGLVAALGALGAVAMLLRRKQ